jgi:hypothetical protein
MVIKRFRNISSIALLGVLGVMVLMSMTAGSPAYARQQTRFKHHASAELDHTPYDRAQLTWSPKTGFLRVTITLKGLAPNSVHPAHIQQGDCDSDGSILYPLINVVANASGNGSSTTTIPAVAGGIPESGWYINVNNGPSLATSDQFASIACGDVSNPDAFSERVQVVRVELGSTSAPNQGAFGDADFDLNGSTLTVVVTLQGLEPSSRHPVYVRVGSCENQKPGNIVFPLNNVVANDEGDAISTTVISHVHTIPTNRWYISVHNTQDLSNQTGFDLISCGNVH